MDDVAEGWIHYYFPDDRYLAFRTCCIRRIHQTMEGDMYWNCQRVREDLANWDLFVAEEDGIAGEAMVMACDGFYEIFALGCENVP